jgi:hypothetical protein
MFLLRSLFLIALFLIVHITSEGDAADAAALSVLPEKEPYVDVNEKDDYKVLGLDPKNHLIGEIYSNWLRIKTWPTLSDEQKNRAKDAYHTLLLKHRAEEREREQNGEL